MSNVPAGSRVPSFNYRTASMNNRHLTRPLTFSLPWNVIAGFAIYLVGDLRGVVGSFFLNFIFSFHFWILEDCSGFFLPPGWVRVYRGG